MDLTDEQWGILKPLAPVPPRRADAKGRPRRDPRDVLNGIFLWVLPTGELPGATCPSATLPTRPATQTCHRRFERWNEEEGVLEEILRALAEDLEERGGLDLCECFVEATTFVGAKKGEDRWERPSGARALSSRWRWQTLVVFLTLRMGGERSSARGHPRRGDARRQVRLREARAADRGPRLGLRPARRPVTAGGGGIEMIAPHPRRTGKKAQEGPRRPKTGVSSGATRGAGRSSGRFRLARELPAPGDPLRAEGRELPRVREAGVHRHPPEVFVRWLLDKVSLLAYE